MRRHEAVVLQLRVPAHDAIDLLEPSRRKSPIPIEAPSPGHQTLTPHTSCKPGTHPANSLRASNSAALASVTAAAWTRRSSDPMPPFLGRIDSSISTARLVHTAHCPTVRRKTSELIPAPVPTRKAARRSAKVVVVSRVDAISLVVRYRPARARRRRWYRSMARLHATTSGISKNARHNSYSSRTPPTTG